MSDGTWSYKLIIDPLTRGLRRDILRMIEPGSRVLDIACGTGALVFEIARKASEVTGIDLNSGKIRYGNTQVRKLGLNHVRFMEADATKLDTILPQSFDFVVLSLAIHQFPEPLRTEILKQSLRISKNLILADYTIPRPESPAGWLALGMEILAGNEHYSAYKTYVTAGGLPGITKQLNLFVLQTITSGSDVFTIQTLTSKARVGATKGGVPGYPYRLEG